MPQSPTYREAATPDTTIATKIATVTAPLDIQANDSMIAIQFYALYDAVNDDYVDPVGWTLIQDIGTNSNIRVRVFGRVATLSDAGQSWDWHFPTAGSGTKGGVILGVWYNTAFVTVFDVAGNAGTGFIENSGSAAQGSTASTNHTMPGFTTGTTDDNVMLVEIMADRGGPGSTAFTWPSGVGWVIPTDLSVIESGGGAVSIAVAYNTNLVAHGTAVGGETVVGTIATKNAVMVTLALRAGNAITTVTKAVTLLFNQMDRKTKVRTLLFNTLQNAGPTQVGKSITLLHNTLAIVSVSPTILYNVGFRFVEVINDFATMYDGLYNTQIIETIPDLATVTDSVAPSLQRVTKTLTFLFNNLTGLEQDVTLVYNVNAGLSVSVGVTLKYNTHRSKSSWTEQGGSPVDWTEDVDA